MTCKTLEVTGAMPTFPAGEIIDYGFAEVEYVNSKLEPPCTLDIAEASGMREAIFVKYKISGITGLSRFTGKFTAKYRTPSGAITTWTWTKTYTALQNFIYTHYHHAISKKYEPGTYEFVSMELDFS